VKELELPDLSDHPPAPSVDLKTFERWVIGVFIPQAIASGELTQASAIARFEDSEGRQTEPWPDFGAALGVTPGFGGPGERGAASPSSARPGVQ
jgi:hypothetical protein